MNTSLKHNVYDRHHRIYYQELTGGKYCYITLRSAERSVLYLITGKQRETSQSLSPLYSPCLINLIKYENIFFKCSTQIKNVWSTIRNFVSRECYKDAIVSKLNMYKCSGFSYFMKSFFFGFNKVVTKLWHQEFMIGFELFVHIAPMIMFW